MNYQRGRPFEGMSLQRFALSFPCHIPQWDMAIGDLTSAQGGMGLGVQRATNCID